jgi:hypothetical protein
MIDCAPHFCNYSQLPTWSRNYDKTKRAPPRSLLFERKLWECLESVRDGQDILAEGPAS